MKKLLVLLMVLGMTQLASAGLIFTVNGEPQPDEIYLQPSQTIEIGLELEQGQTIAGYQIMYTLSNEQGELLYDGSEPSFYWPGGMFVGKVNGYDQEGVCTWVEIAASNFGTYASGPLDLMDGLIFHCLEATDVILTVTGVVDLDGVSGVDVDHTLIIHQPEPMTIALLGLGGLFLRRRK